MASFMDYYNEELNKRTSPSVAPKRKKAMTLAELGEQQQTEQQAERDAEGPLGFLGRQDNPIGWTLDMASRPLYGVTNAINKSSEQGIVGGKKMATGDASGAGDIASGIANFLPNFLEGVFSNEKQHKRTTADTIENLTDKYGESVDPNYVNRENNVDPLVKGIGGFAGDVLLDPLTWTGVGAVASLAKGGVNALRKAAPAVDAWKAAEPVAEAAVKAKKPKAPKPVSEDAELAEAMLAPAAATSTRAAGQADEMGDFLQSNPNWTDPELDAAPLPKPAATPVAGASFLSGFDDLAAVKVAEKAAVTTKAAETAIEEVLTGKGVAEVIRNSSKTAGARDEIKSMLDMMLKGDEAVDVPAAAPVKAPTMQETVEYARANPEVSIQAQLTGDPTGRRYTVQQLLVQGSKEAAKVNPKRAQAALLTLRQMAQDSRTGASASAILRGAEAVAERVQRGGNDLVNILGPEAVDLITRAAGKGDTALTQALTRFDTIFDGKVVDFEEFSHAPGNARVAASTLPLYREELTRPRAPKPREEIVEEIKNGPLSPVSSAILGAFKQWESRKTGRNPIAFDETGSASWWRKPNTFFQVDALRGLRATVEDRVRGRLGVPLTPRSASDKALAYGAPRAAAYRAEIEGLADEMVDSLEALGIPLYIGTKGDVTKLTFPQVYAELGRTLDELAGPEVANLILHNFGTAVVPSRLLNVVNDALLDETLDVQEIAQLIRKKTLDSDGPNNGKTLPNNIRASWQGKAAGSGYYFLPNGAKAAKALADSAGGRVVKDGKDGLRVVFDEGGNLPEILAHGIAGARAGLAARAAANEAEWAARGIAEAADISGTVLANLNRLAADPSKAAQRESQLAIARLDKQIADEAAARTATLEGQAAAKAAVEAAVGPEALADAKIALRQDNAILAGEDFEEAGKAAAISRAANVEDELMDALIRSTDEGAGLVEDLPVKVAKTKKSRIEQIDVAELADKTVQGVAVGTWQQRAGRFFNQGHDINGAMQGKQWAIGNNIGMTAVRTVLRPLKDLTRKYPAPVLTNAMKGLQNGTKFAPDSELGQAALALDKILSTLFDTSPGAGLGNVFLDSGSKLNATNATLRWAFKGDKIQFDKAGAEAAAKAALGSKATQKQLKAKTAENLRNQWRQWDLGTDVADSVTRLSQAAARVVEHEATAASFVHTGLKEGFAVKVKAGSRPPAGFVKLVDGRGTTTMTGLLPKDVFVHKDIVPTFARMEYLMTESRQLDGSVGDFLRGTVVPMTNVWKQTMTIYRLGHHIRNLVGNLSLQFVSRGVRDFNKSSMAAYKIMAQRNTYEGVDFLTMLKTLGDEAVPTGGDILVRGRFGDMSAIEIIEEMSRRGMFPTYEASEGLLTSEVKTGGVVERILRPLDSANNPIGRAGGAVSEVTDHYSRAHHFVQILMQESRKGGSKWKGNVGKEELFNRAALEVKKLHPDSSMLTGSENAIMKLAIPFYSWMRGVLPGALESAVMHPGRVMVFPKASYNLAIAMGLDPDSLSDPFPEDQLFPSFITEGVLGPQFKIDGKYVRINPGIAQFDLAESFGLGSTNPAEGALRGILGMTNPLFRVPAELASGGSWSTGGRISDTSDYVDQTIPFVNVLSNLSGTSLTGSAMSLPTGGGLDPQAQVAKGNKTDFDTLLAGLNWLTGAGIQNLSRPNYINYAEIEQRNKAGEAQ